MQILTSDVCILYNLNLAHFHAFECAQVTFGRDAGAKRTFHRNRRFRQIRFNHQRIGNDADIRTKPDNFNFADPLRPAQVSGKLG